MACSTATEYATAVKTLSADIVKADPQGVKTIGVPSADPAQRMRNVLLAVGRILDAMVQELRCKDRESQGGGGLGKDGTLNVVNLGTEEDRALSLQSFGTDEMAMRKKVIFDLYNEELTPFEVADLRHMKKFAHWA